MATDESGSKFDVWVYSPDGQSIRQVRSCKHTVEVDLWAEDALAHLPAERLVSVTIAGRKEHIVTLGNVRALTKALRRIGREEWRIEWMKRFPAGVPKRASAAEPPPPADSGQLRDYCYVSMMGMSECLVDDEDDNDVDMVREWAEPMMDAELRVLAKLSRGVDVTPADLQFTQLADFYFPGMFPAGLYVKIRQIGPHQQVAEGEIAVVVTDTGIDALESVVTDPK